MTAALLEMWFTLYVLAEVERNQYCLNISMTHTALLILDHVPGQIKVTLLHFCACANVSLLQLMDQMLKAS